MRTYRVYHYRRGGDAPLHFVDIDALSSKDAERIFKEKCPEWSIESVKPYNGPDKYKRPYPGV